MQIIYSILIVEMWVLFWIYFYEDSFFKAYRNIGFWLMVLSSLICFYSLGKSSVITMTKNNEIIKEIFIGK